MDVKAMREIVKAATPGKWMLGDENNTSAEVMLGAKHNLVVSLDRYDKNTGEQVISREQMLANARHIITFNPESVTALLNALEAAQARIKELEADVVCRESERNEIGAKVDELYMMLAYRDTQPPEQESAATVTISRDQWEELKARHPETMQVLFGGSE